MTSISIIQQTVCRDFGVSMLDLVSQRRGRDIVIPRHVGMWLAAKATTSSLPQIGRAFGNRDHTTVMNALDRINQRMTSDPLFASLVRSLLQAVENGSVA